ncbi:MAG: transglycosylase domain-containing protein, partial [Acidimicrobiia bacterium]
MRFDMRARHQRVERDPLAAPAVARARLVTAVLATHLWLPRRRSRNGAEAGNGADAAVEAAPDVATDVDVVLEPIGWSPYAPVVAPRRLLQLARAVRTFVIIVVLGGLSVGALLAAAIPGAQVLATSNQFTPANLEGRLSVLSQRTTVYDAFGNEIGVLAIEDRQPVDLEEVPQIVIDAVIATEDQSFFDNPGVDVGGLFRAFVENATSGEIEQGGSTISQQLVKNRVLNSSRDLDRKVREIVLAYRLNEQYTKREILEEYLNTVYFGQGSYGIKSAAERIFRFVDPTTGEERGKRLDELNIADAALLASLIANPEGDNPFVYPERAAERRAETLDLQVEEGYLTETEAEFAEQAPLPTIKPPAERRPQNFWVEEVQKRLLADPRLGDTEQERRDRILRGGLEVHTTLDPIAQFQAQTAVDQQLPPREGFTAALVAIEPTTGFVRAMVGGPGFDQSQYNIATYPPGQQAGSSWKVITLAAALDGGYSPNDVVSGTAPCTVPSGPGYADPGRPGRVTTRNAEGGGGTMTIRQATVGSVNCAFARIASSVGYDRVMDVAHRLGIKQELGRFGSDGVTWYPARTPVLTLGVFESTPLEMATVGATIANNGVRKDPVFVERVEGPDGEIVFDDRQRPGEQAISPEAASCEIDILRGVITGGTGTGARLSNHTAAGKTGTTDGQVDANFLGFTPQLVAHVWYGSPVADIPGAGFGGETPASIWRAFMEAYMAGKPE